ncbi:hypothetical protein CVV26_03375 [Candidatus Kuenenbacteria bacterium HGW-Kuenenbacteria-1]|uniref:Uncharacterized protein n=1 Tax=Candidatus Kuenenbacteria bacterium HGW-Kuenenbacteria-1 TaxID=2013812 RepID=A0A2N1UMP0_9BACT|nr:MAG: hypothetical protein CVV26_03375 [Candidatus Kuenenbacteria bacterium HGW-Kuenenbacteria-1]
MSTIQELLEEFHIEKTEVCEEMEKGVKDFVKFNMTKEAFDFSKNLTILINGFPNFKENYPYLFERYQDLNLQIKWLTLFWLSEREIIFLFEENFVKVFELEFFDIWEKIKLKLISISFCEDRDELKKKIIEALLRNKEIFTSQILVQDDKKYKPSISNWLLIYNRLLGTSPLPRLKIAQFLVSNSNVKKLKPLEKEKFRTLINLYEKLKLSSLTLEGFEEDISVNEEGKIGVIKEGIFYPENEKAIYSYKKAIKDLEDSAKFEKILQPLKQKNNIVEAYPSVLPENSVGTNGIRPIKEEISTKEKILAGYFKGHLEQKVIYNFEREIIDDTKKDSEKIKIILKQALVVPEIEKAIAALKILAQINELPELVKDEKIGQGFIVFLSELGETITVDDLKRLSNSIKYTNLLLQYILKNKLGLSENDSAKIGVQFANILSVFNRDFGKMVYFNADKGEFRWS